MKFIGNLIWLIFGGFIESLVYFIYGIIFCLTIVGIPLGRQLIKIGSLILWPFGTEVRSNFSHHPLLNLLWLCIGGWVLVLMQCLIGLIYCLTIIGIPFGKEWFKIASLSLAPFGADLN